ncbi:autotransporter assembly complex protein TamA [Methylobacterium isbiliense]|uniref:Outer membrane protein assembly factor BamA n=1 Tax=Methylobacterium isbiliense TaxID=315478 RepID=A0ABQ4SB47_9HYPH|nr:autotransporter assembly complex family protein [Methylobacterium isbiliense]MDN3624405.1 autotransporter assembly complex family protein [Methylobacterium isbiliense]GJD99377.1 Outer membrane protein assembly factor BamA [Methylobacterium isbiliense]
MLGRGRTAHRIGRHGRPGALALGACLVTGLLAPSPARAFDLFGLFGGEEAPPAPRPDAVAYAVRIQGVADGDLLPALQDASTLYRLRAEPPPDGEGLLRRAEADAVRLVDALWGYGYYAGTVAFRIEDVLLGGDGAARAAVRAAEAARNRRLAAVRIIVEQGPLYRLRGVAVRDAAGRPLPLPPRLTRVAEEEPARSATVLAREARIVDHLRGEGHPFAKVVRREPVVDHAARTLDVTITVDPGPFATLGAVTVRGTRDLDPAVVRSFIYAEPGDPYSPEALAGIRRSVSRIEALGGVRVREGQALDPDGGLPVFVDVTERAPNLLGVSARYSTVDGPGVRGYWANRNLFGGGESLRIDADLSYLGLGTDYYARRRKLAGIETNGLGGRLAATFVKPALFGSRTDLVAGAFVGREVQQSYLSDAAGGTLGLRHRFSDTVSVQGGVEGQVGSARDALGRVDYRLVGLPVSVAYDSTDSLLDPTRGIRLTASATPYPGFLGSDPGLFLARAQGSTYLALDDEANTILAARLGFGSISGAGLAEIPASLRFFAGGGGSIRGYAYRTVGPIGPFQLPIGGRSLLEGSLEARIKLTDTIGLVPFVDAGTAFASSLPDFDEPIRYAAGLGLRYYTGIGPIRVDLAVPLNPDKALKQPPVALYISIGQAF